MKTTHLIFFILLFSLTVSAQKKMTDREFEGFKGEVKSVLMEHVQTVNSRGLKPDMKRIIDSEYFFDKDGRLTQILYTPFNSKLVFTIIDGFKTFKSFELKKETNPRGGFADLVEPQPIEKPEKLVPPDKRFNLKYVYEYDSQGRVKTERQYLNNGKLSSLTTYKYDAEGRVKEENINDTVALSQFVYKYDEKGNLIETLQDRDIKEAGVDSKTKTVYSDYKVDAQGNWTQRKSVWYFEVEGKPIVSESMSYRTIVYY